MFDKLRIRTKLIAIVAAPLAALMILAFLGGMQRRSQASDRQADAARITVAELAAAAADEVQQEALLTTAALGGTERVTPKALKAQRAESDAAVSAFKQSLGDLPDAGTVDSGAVRAANGQFQTLPDLRAQVDRGDSDWAEVLAQYAQVDDALMGVVSAFPAEIGDARSADGASGLAALAAYKSSVARESALLSGVIAQGGFAASGAGATKTPAADLRARYDKAADATAVNSAVWAATAGSEERTAVRNKLAGPSVDTLEAARSAAADSGVEAPAGARAAVHRQAASDVVAKLRTVEAGAAEALVASARSEAGAAGRSARLFFVGALIALLISLGLAIAVASSITRPLAELTTAVDHVAKHQLPRLVESLRNPTEDDGDYLGSTMTDIEVGGGEELSHLGTAVNSIQRVAVEVATEQASLLRKGIGEMFVNLARRNQALLDRQIEFIDSLEADEEDPDHLESLFKLDHMATRMRRNAESLLVLAGAEPTRRRGRPVPLTDVVRAALGEVEDYGRIDLLSLDDVMVKSTAALDVAHLLSELMENATHFSPPDTRVEVVGHRTQSEGYVVSITDHGIGMAPDQLTEANELLAHPPLVGLALSRSLGFIVIGRLSARFDIQVRLMGSPTGGVTAVVSIPSLIITEIPPSIDELSAPLPRSRPDESLASVTSITGESTQVPPLEYATFDEAVPVGEAFDAGLAAMVDEAEASTPTASVGSHQIDPAVVAFGMPERMATSTDDLVEVPEARSTAPAPTDRGAPTPGPFDLPPRPAAQPAPAAPVAAPIAPAAPVPPPAPPARRPQAPSARPEAMPSSAGPEALPESLPLPPSAPEALPEALPPAAALPETLPTALPETLPGDGVLPAPVGEQPLPATGPFEPPVVDPRAGGPFATPTSSFFGSAAEPAHPTPPGPPPAPARNGAVDGLFAPVGPAPAPRGQRPPPPPPSEPTPVNAPPTVPTSGLFGAATPAAGAPPAGPRLFGAAATPGDSTTPRLFGAPPAPASPAAPAPAQPGVTPASGDVTNAGLVRRKPRSTAEGATRRLPGSDGGERNGAAGAGATQRSPEEVRAMLSRFRSGAQQASASQPRPAQTDPTDPAAPAAP